MRPQDQKNILLNNKLENTFDMIEFEIFIELFNFKFHNVINTYSV